MKWVGRRVPRVDALDKVTGKLRFAADFKVPNMIYGKALRSKLPHARIQRIDIDEARRYPGVVAILTGQDVEGSNLYGTIKADQEVLCRSKVRCVGDPVALVGAETEEAAAAAVDLIRVDYQPLPIITDPFKAMEEHAERIHDGGNILHHLKVAKGDVEAAFRRSDIIVEGTYVVSGRQMPAPIEPEAGVAYLEGETITLYASTQSPYEDQFQISGALGIPREKIRVIAAPVGGGFGGKCDATVQLHLALLASKTKRPVKVVWSRGESIVSGYKRHPMKIYMKTSAVRDGTLLANKVRIVADTGAYASYGAVVLTVGMESSCGPYRIENAEVEGFSVLTNNGISGAVNGFAVPQLSFAMESQLDKLAEKLKMDPIDLRKMNAFKKGDHGPIGFKVVESTEGFHRSLEMAKKHRLWQNRSSIKNSSGRPWLKRGVGVACAMKGCGFQNVVKDEGSVSLELEQDGRFLLSVSCPDIGQGNRTAFAQIAAEALHCKGLDEVGIVQGDTLMTPNTGQTVASMTVYKGGSAIMSASAKMNDLMLDVASRLLNTPKDQLSISDSAIFEKDDPGRAVSFSSVAQELLRNGSKPRVEGTFAWPRFNEKDLEGVDPKVAEISHVVYDLATTLAVVEVDELTGAVKLLNAVPIVDVGTVINPLGFEGQQEGCIVMGMGFATMENVVTQEGLIKTPGFSTYLLPTAADSPMIEVLASASHESGGPFGAKGAGESGILCIAAAMANAVYDAVGVRLDTLPFTPEVMYRALKSARRGHDPESASSGLYRHRA